MFQIPKNVMQIGQSNPHCKIYVEDYVHTFLKQRKKDEVYLAFGKKEEIDGVLYYLVYGAEKKTDWDRGNLPYFKKYDRLGTLEGTAEKRVFRPIRQEAMKLDSFFVFYEQNEDMQSYMITVREKEDMQQERETEKEAVMEAVKARRELRAREHAGGQPEPDDKRLSDDGQPSASRRFSSGQHISSSSGIRRRELKRRERAQRRMLTRRGGTSRTLFAKRSRGDKIAWPVQKEKTPWSIPKICRVASVCLLLVLAVTGASSATGLSGLQSAGKLLGEAVSNIKLLSNRESAATLNDIQQEFAGTQDSAADEQGSSDSVQGSFIIEETQLEDMVSAGEQAETSDTALSAEQSVTVTAPAAQSTENSGQIQWTIGQTQDTAVDEVPSAENVDEASSSENIDAASSSENTDAASRSETADSEIAASADADSLTVASSDAASAAAETTSIPESYTVQKGDSLAGICRRFYGDTSRLYEICRLNNISDPNQIQRGQNILLPQ